MKIKDLISNKGKILIGPKIITPTIFNDERGYFYESWNQSTLDEGLDEKINFIQDNHSCSKRGVIRGLHYQIPPKPQNKLIKCLSGEIFDVAVDIRKSSPTFGEWCGVKLNNHNKFMLWIPIGFAHGFLSLKDNSEVSYKVSGHWSKSHERSIRWNDKDINIDWPLELIEDSELIVSHKDANANFLRKSEIFN